MIDIVLWLKNYAQECSRVSDAETQMFLLIAAEEIESLRDRLDILAKEEVEEYPKRWKEMQE